MRMRKILGILMLLAVVAGCSRPTPDAPREIRVVATTTLVGDVVRQVGGDAIALTVLLPYGVDPHAFDPTPQDLARIADADLVFANGAGLEEFLSPLLENAGGAAQIVQVSEGIPLLAMAPGAEEEHEHTGGDPHTWIDPNNVKIWVANIAAALTQADPEHAASYQANAAAYTAELVTLDAWIREQVAQVPEAHRLLVTDHQLFGYFAEEYGFVQVGAIIPAYSTAAQPSAQELASLEDAIRSYAAPAIFVGSTVNPTLAEQVAQDTGVRLVRVYTGSLTEPGGEADSYLSYMRYNVTAMVEALR